MIEIRIKTRIFKQKILVLDKNYKNVLKTATLSCVFDY